MELRPVHAPEGEQPPAGIDDGDVLRSAEFASVRAGRLGQEHRGSFIQFGSEDQHRERPSWRLGSMGSIGIRAEAPP